MAADAAVGARAAALDAAWLSGRRWFGSKRRPLERVTVVDAAALDGGRLWLLVLLAEHRDGGTDRYLVPAVSDADGSLREPIDGEGAWRALVLAMLAGADLEATAGRFRCAATPALAGLLPEGQAEARQLDERRLQVEQSNTSVRLGDRLILKIYRRLQPGINPELEMNAFLTEAGFRYAPALAGTLTYVDAAGEPVAAAMAQALVASRGDGWGWALSSLSAPPAGLQEALAGSAQIGGITAEMHGALASRPEDRQFPARTATPEERAAWQARAEQQLDAALEAVSDAQHERLAGLAPRARERLAAIGRAEEAVASRIHGDYHLGQLLRTEHGFMVIDFEGEPARPLDERRSPASPLRDVAGMLRSFDYAARTAERSAGPGFDPGDWLADARSAFLAAYDRSAEEQRELLAALEVEKACYEIRYEANNRPDWVWLPLEALERLVR